jgi:hypothetical protein
MIKNIFKSNNKKGITDIDRVGVTGSNPVSPTMIKKT